MKILMTGLFIFYFSAGQSCLISANKMFSQNKKVKFSEIFTLKPDETAETEDEKLKVKLKSVGRTISESGETEYAELEIRLNNSERKLQISERRKKNSVKAGNYIIKLINAESFGNVNCELQITHR